ncbi:fibroblast growth factor receptor-like 1 [Trichonephila clavata]|uniref:Fibroblast growth factor receptor-like 1 n=1 Tax=Trichonephila clavata TaxID=2740835 RepID=A0A8X6GUP1_TRICU|nr:fibroblast growth factor receptor-like 1 [Trichonephila clavata]
MVAIGIRYSADFPNPPQILSLEPTESAIEEGEAAVFWCEIYIGSKPSLKLYIKWFKKLNEEITSDSPVMNDATLFRFGANFYRPITLPNGISTNPGPDGFYKSKLLIPNTCVADSGTYICLALNDKGFNFKNVTLTVTSTAAHSKKISPNQNCFSVSDTFLVVIAVISSALILIAVILISQQYCRGSSNKVVAT